MKFEERIKKAQEKNAAFDEIDHLDGNLTPADGAAEAFVLFAELPRARKEHSHETDRCSD